MQETPRQGTQEEWEQVVVILNSMVEKQYILIAELMVIFNRIARLSYTDPMRRTEEQAVLDLLAARRIRSLVPRGVAAFLALGAPPPRAAATPTPDPPDRGSSPPQSHPRSSGNQDRGRPTSPQPGPSGA